uniref:Palmitoyltransferase n=1 Tax=Panagrellus redivivus TaxID=6233 RepID=A0A7E4VAK3_PANRE
MARGCCVDPCGFLCVLLVWGCMIYADYVVVQWLVLPTFSETVWGAIHILIFNTLMLLAFLSHLRTMSSDPGYVPVHKVSPNEIDRFHRRQDLHYMQQSESDYDSESADDFILGQSQFVGKDWNICMKCQSFRPPRAHHCRICNRCVMRMDHHCPWVANCVGQKTQKYFLQFILYVALLAAYAIAMIILSWVYHDDFGSTGRRGPNGENAQHAKVIHTICLGIESALFGLFVLAVSCDQLQAIFNEETMVESIQRRGLRRRRQRRPKFELLREVCGPGHWLLWILPCNSLPGERDILHIPRDAAEHHLNV